MNKIYMWFSLFVCFLSTWHHIDSSLGVNNKKNTNEVINDGISNEFSTQTTNYNETEKVNQGKRYYNMPAEIQRYNARNTTRNISIGTITYNKLNPIQITQSILIMEEREIVTHPLLLDVSHKQDSPKSYPEKRMARRRKRDESQILFSNNDKRHNINKRAGKTETLLEQIRDMLKSINDKIPLFNSSDSAKSLKEKNIQTLLENIKLLGLDSQRQKIKNHTQEASPMVPLSEHNLGTTDNLSLIKKKIISLKKKIDSHKLKYGIKHEGELHEKHYESTTTILPTTTLEPKQALQQAKFDALNSVLDHLSMVFNQRSHKNGNPELGENVLELLEKVIDFEGHELNTTLNASSSESNMKLYESGFVIFASAFVVLLVVLLLLCFFYKYEVRVQSQKGNSSKRKDPIFKVTPRRKIRKKYGPRFDETEEYKRKPLEEMLRTTKYARNMNFRKEDERDLAKKDFVSIEGFLKWDEERRRAEKSVKDSRSLGKKSKMIDRLDPKCSFYYQKMRDSGMCSQDEKVVGKDSSGELSLKNWTKDAGKNVTQSARNLGNNNKKGLT